MNRHQAQPATTRWSDEALKTALADQRAAELLQRVRSGLVGPDALAVEVAQARGADLLAITRAICKALRSLE